jgi:hypothetical protein
MKEVNTGTWAYVCSYVRACVRVCVCACVRVCVCACVRVCVDARTVQGGRLRVACSTNSQHAPRVVHEVPTLGQLPQQAFLCSGATTTGHSTLRHWARALQDISWAASGDGWVTTGHHTASISNKIVSSWDGTYKK